MKCEIYKLNSLRDYKYVVVFAKYNNKWVFCKHRRRETWETAGGHIEENETPLEAAKRELYEESGAVDFKIVPLCDYWAGDEKSGANGMVFTADISVLGGLPESEMEKVALYDGLPEKLTYPDITPKLYEYILLGRQRCCSREVSSKG